VQILQTYTVCGEQVHPPLDSLYPLSFSLLKTVFGKFLSAVSIPVLLTLVWI
jgi:hypothetical protein